MRVNRRFLYWGVFLTAVGGVLVATDLGRVDPATIEAGLRLWPLAFVAIGLGLVLRRTRFSLPGGLVAVAIPGLLLGGGFAVVPRFAVDCGAGDAPATVATQQGTFDGPAQVSVSSGCGSLVVDTASGAGWRLDAGDTSGRVPIIEASTNSLSIDAADGTGWHGFNNEYEVWRLTLPTTSIDDLSFAVNAGEGRIDLAGAQIGHLAVTTNAAHTTVNLSEASMASLSGTVNAGMLSFRLPAASDLVASLEANAGALQVCFPEGLGLLVHHTGELSAISVSGQHLEGTNWQSPDYASAAHHAELNVTVNLGNVEINPIGGCK